jgi:hypothetical protein
MNEERRRILSMLSQGKITAEEAESLLDALPPEAKPAAVTGTAEAVGAPKYLRVVVEGGQGPHGGKVNVRVPMNLIRAGVRLAAVLPNGVHDQVNKALKENGIEFDVSKIKPENLEELVEQLAELTVDVEGNDGERVKVFCE